MFNFFDNLIDPLKAKASQEIKRGVESVSNRATDAWQNLLLGGDNSSDYQTPHSTINTPKSNPVTEIQNQPNIARSFLSGGMNWKVLGLAAVAVGALVVLFKFVRKK